MILVTGATGTVGSELVKRLLASGESVRVLVHSPEKAVFLEELGAEVLTGDFEKLETLGAALRGVEKAFLLTPLSPQQVEMERNFIEAAQRMGTSHVVKLSVMGANVNAESVNHRRQGIAERLLEQSGLQFTHLRPNFFMQNLFRVAPFVAEHGAFFLPMGNARCSMVDVRDIAAVAAAVLTEDGHEGKVYEITGPESLSFDEVAEKLSAAIGKPVSYMNVSPEEFIAQLLQTGLPAWLAEAQLGSFLTVRRGLLARVTNVVAEVGGINPTSFDQFARDYAPLFRSGQPPPARVRKRQPRRRRGEKRQAVVISGGGARAAYGVGVMKALFNGESPATNYEPLNPDIYAGTSAGAFNAAFLVARPEADAATALAYLEDLWLNELTREDATSGNQVFRYRLDPFRLLNPQNLAENSNEVFAALMDDASYVAQDWFRRGLNFFLTDGSLERRVMELFDISLLFSVTPLESLLKDVLSLEGIRDSDKELRIATTNWRTGEVKIFENKEMVEGIGHQTILASSSLPGIFPPVNIGGAPYVDGGVVMNTPLKPAIEAGAETLHVIYLDHNAQSVPLMNIRNIIDTINRIFIISFAATVNRDIQIASRINDALYAIEKTARGEELTESDAKRFVLTAGKFYQQRNKTSAPYRPLTIHRYHPQQDLGGIFKMLAFRRDMVSQVLELGFNETMMHDCVANQCVFPR